MQRLHPGLKKLFSSLSIASKRVAQRREAEEKLRSYLRKIKIVSSQSSKKSVMTSELQHLEKHISDMLDTKLSLVNLHGHEKQHELTRLKEKEQELDEKIVKLNELLAQVGKKVNEKKLLEQLEEKQSSPMIDELEEKLYSLETRYHVMKDDPKYPEALLNNVREKISALKEKIRELKN